MGDLNKMRVRRVMNKKMRERREARKIKDERD